MTISTITPRKQVTHETPAKTGKRGESLNPKKEKAPGEREREGWCRTMPYLWVKEVLQTSDIKTVNALLGAGWKLIIVCHKDKVKFILGRKE